MQRRLQGDEHGDVDTVLPVCGLGDVLRERGDVSSASSLRGCDGCTSRSPSVVVWRRSCVAWGGDGGTLCSVAVVYRGRGKEDDSNVMIHSSLAMLQRLGTAMPKQVDRLIDLTFRQLSESMM